MIKKTKICTGCGKEKLIWKSAGTDKYCHSCWYQLKPNSLSTPLPVKKVKKIKPVSTKRVKQNSVYTQVRQAFLYKNEFCKARLSICTMWATEVHHMKGRIEDLLTDERYFLPVCRRCHDWIETHPHDAHDLGLSLYRLEKNDR
jgi:hypothetical protein